MRQRISRRKIAAYGFAASAALLFDPDLVRAAATTAPKIQLAYIDPGSGSFVLQALIAAVAGAAVAINAYWRRIKQFLGIGALEPKDDAKDSESSDA